MTLRTSALLAFLALSSTFALAACDDDDDTGTGGNTADGGSTTDGGSKSDAATGGGGDKCATLCTGAGFSGGAATDFGGGVVECVCEGSGQGIAKAACEAYCAPLPPEKAYLSENKAPNDKCVCDGT